MSEIVAEGIVEARTLRDYLSVYTALVDEARIHWNDDGLLGRFVDAANVCLVRRTTLSADAFESYESPGSATIGVPITKLVERIKPADPDTLIHLAVDMEIRKLRIEYGRSKQTLGLIDPDSIRSEPSDDPNLDLPNWATVTGESFKEALEIADLVSDHVFVRGEPDERQFTVYAQGDVDDGTVTFGDEDVLEASVSEATESVYSLDYLEELADPIPSDTEVELRFGEEHPIQVHWGAFEGMLQTEAMLAPRIQTN